MIEHYHPIYGIHTPKHPVDGCNFCSGRSYFDGSSNKRMSTYLDIDSQSIAYELKDKKGGAIWEYMQIEYCPMCGRKLVSDIEN